MKNDKKENKALSQTSVIPCFDSSYIGKKVRYKSEITKSFTIFTIESIICDIEEINGQIFSIIYLVSKNGNKYRIDGYSEVFL